MHGFVFLLFFILLSASIYALSRVWQRGMYIWLPAYVRSLGGRQNNPRGSKEQKTTHVFFTFVDHYEPGNGDVDEKEMQRRVDAWLAGYPAMAKKYTDADGRHPQHTWFYPPHYDIRHLKQISALCFAGLGEIEMHLHHENDTPESLRHKLQECLRLYNQHGALISAESQPKAVYGFIHGNWALCNSAHGKYCGVNEELTVLRETGCFADFTMPSCNESQTKKINSIYVAEDTPGRPKSHDTGTDLEVGKFRQGGLVIFQGPLGINWKRRPYPRIENASITSENPPTPDRIDYWIQCGIGVKKKPEWVFVKVHTHGAVPRDWEAVFGTAAEKMHTYLREKYNDGVNYKLHYVTAREAYNICEAAVMGLSGDPNEYRDYVIKPYVNTKLFCSSQYKIMDYNDTEFALKVLEPKPEKTILDLKEFSLRRIEGSFSAVQYKERGAAIELRILGSQKQPGAAIDLTSSRPLSECSDLAFIGTADAHYIYRGYLNGENKLSIAAVIRGNEREVTLS